MIWLSAPIRSVAQVVTGNTPPKSDDTNYGNDVPWVKPPELGSTKPIVATSEMLSTQGAERARVLPKDAVLVSCIGSIGRVGIAGVPLATNQQINAVVCGPGLLPRFAMYWFMHSADALSAAANSAVVPILNKGNFEKMLIPVWPLREQARIVELLDEADRLRRLRREADAKAACILPALFLKLFGDPAMNPMGWPEKPLSKVIETVEAGWSALSDGRPREGNEHGVLKVSAVTSGVFRPEENKAVIDVSKARSLIIPKRGDLLFSRANTRELVAASCVVESDCQNLFLPDKLWRLGPVHREASGMFLKELFWRDGIRDKFRAASSGSSGSMLNISQDAMLRTVAPIPPFHLQERFESLAWDVMDALHHAKVAAEGIDSIWSNLLQHAFSGQLTAQWREAHMQELLDEMAQQARDLNLPMLKDLETLP